ncbi:PH domain-containing protein [Tersicoccus sp. MR15.9]|uniref:PH domain-containing protein n=1 Tax=Tersicoccus mangrovi TaxID=3121635 RepID=UPI002FE5CA28
MSSRALRRLLRGTDPREELLVVTRPRAHRLVRTFVAMVVIVAAAGLAAGWLSRRHADPVLTSMQPVLLLAVVIGAVAAAGVFVVRPFLRWYRTRYVLTSARMIRRDGRRRTPTEVWLPAVLHVHVAQSLAQRMVRAGDLYVDSVSGRLVLPDAPHARRFAGIVSDAVDRSRPGVPGYGQAGYGQAGYGRSGYGQSGGVPGLTSGSTAVPPAGRPMVAASMPAPSFSGGGRGR